MKNDISSVTEHYLSEEEWNRIQNMLNTAAEVLKKISCKVGANLFNDSRWPAYGLEFNKLFKKRYIRITLNHEYLQNKEIFFELIDHSVVVLPFGICKILNNNIVMKMDIEVMNNEQFLENNIMNLVML